MATGPSRARLQCGDRSGRAPTAADRIGGKAGQRGTVGCAAQRLQDGSGVTATPPGTSAAGALVDGPITGALVRFALPLLITNFLYSIAGTWGAIWVSHVLGAQALTAVLTGNLFLVMMLGAVTGIGTASGVAIGQAFGAGDLTAVRRVAGSTLTFVTLLSLAIATAGFAFTPAILALMRMPAAALEPATVYLRCVCLAMPPFFVYMVAMMMLRGVGDARTPFRFTLLWIGLSLLFAPMLLTGALGLPRLGIAGVAIGNGLANATALVALTVFVYRQRLPLALRGADLRHLRPDPAMLAMLLRRGLPTAAETLIIQGSYFVLLAVVNGQGALTAAAYSGAAQLWTYVQMPANSLAASMSAMAAINIGARRWDRVGRIALHGCLLSVGCATASTLLIYGLDERVLGLFIPEGGEVLAIARHINRTALWGWIVLSISLGVFAIVRANGAMLAPMIVFGVTMWVFRVPFAVLLQPWLGADAIWWSFPFGSITSALLAWAYYRWGGWRANRPLLAPG